MTSKTIYHYVYRITNLVENKHYYGKRSSRIEPKLDLGKKYFSSSTDKEFLTDQKLNPQNYRYKIVQSFFDVKLALIRESKLHHKFDVGVNLKFYNKVKQTSTKFDTTGTVLSVETREKMSKSKSMMSDETRAKLRKSSVNKNKGKKASKETKEKMSKSQIGRVHSAETKEKMSKAAIDRIRIRKTKSMTEIQKLIQTFCNRT